MENVLIRVTTALIVLAPMGCVLAGCGQSYSPDTYATNAMQQANKVDRGIIVGVRPVAISAQGTVGAVTGAAAGGVAGAQVAPGPVGAFTAIGGSLLGGIAGIATEHATADTNGFEYIVRKTTGELVSVAQKDKKALPVGEKVLVIAGAQARIVPDYTVPGEVPTDPATKPGAAPAAGSPAATAAAPATASPPPPAAASGQASAPGPNAEPPIPPPASAAMPHEPGAPAPVLPSTAVSALPKS